MARDRASLDELVKARGLAPRVLEAFVSLDRADFVPTAERKHAYEDRPIALPRGQTTSQPSLIAAMVDVAAIAGTDRVLELGTGYGFQTALIASLAKEVVSVERHPELAEAAESNLHRAGFSNFKVIIGDGWDGYEPSAPYDAMIVSAAAPKVPDALGAQLGDGGRLVIPVTRAGRDDVVVYRRRGGELIEETVLTPARFVPLVGRDR
jgi:protein-L-isoaspartate(D-aspartate) O-methyltransferase